MNGEIKVSEYWNAVERKNGVESLQIEDYEDCKRQLESKTKDILKSALIPNQSKTFRDENNNTTVFSLIYPLPAPIVSVPHRRSGGRLYVWDLRLCE